MDFDRLAIAEGRPLSYGPMLHPSAYAQITGSCGDTLQFWLNIDGDIIRKASFVSVGSSKYTTQSPSFVSASKLLSLNFEK